MSLVEQSLPTLAYHALLRKHARPFRQRSWRARLLTCESQQTCLWKALNDLYPGTPQGQGASLGDPAPGEHTWLLCLVASVSSYITILYHHR